MARTVRAWLLPAALVLVLGVGAGGWYWYITPVPPEIDLSDAPDGVVKAVETARQAVLQSPRSGWTWGELGMILQANDYAPQAYPCFVQAERFDPTAPIWPYLQALRLMIHDREAALAALRRAVALLDRAGFGDATPRLLLAELLLENDQRAEAAALCRQVLAQDADNPRAHLNLGIIALAEDDAQRGIQHLKRSAESPFTAQRSYYHLASAYRRLGDAANAADALREAKKLPGEQPWPDPYLERTKEYEAGAWRHERRAADPGELLHALRDLAEESGDGVSFYRWGTALAERGDYPAAQAVLETAVQKSPELFRPRFALGVVLLRQGEQMAAKGAPSATAQAQFRKAEECLRQAAERRPAYGLAHLELGKVLQWLDRQAEALAEFRTAVKCQPDLADAHLALGEALAAAGELGEARRHLEEALSLAPSDPRPPAALASLSDGGTKQIAPGKQ